MKESSQTKGGLRKMRQPGERGACQQSRSRGPPAHLKLKPSNTGVGGKERMEETQIHWLRCHQEDVQIGTLYSRFRKGSLALPTNGGCIPSTHYTHALSYTCPGFMQSSTLECLLLLLRESSGARWSFCKLDSQSASQDLGQHQASGSKLPI